MTNIVDSLVVLRNRLVLDYDVTLTQEILDQYQEENADLKAHIQELEAIAPKITVPSVTKSYFNVYVGELIDPVIRIPAKQIKSWQPLLKRTDYRLWSIGKISTYLPSIHKNSDVLVSPYPCESCGQSLHSVGEDVVYTHGCQPAAFPVGLLSRMYPDYTWIVIPDSLDTAVPITAPLPCQSNAEQPTARNYPHIHDELRWIS